MGTSRLAGRLGLPRTCPSSVPPARPLLWRGWRRDLEGLRAASRRRTVHPAPRPDPVARGAGGVSADVKARRSRVDSGPAPAPHAELEVVGVVAGRVRLPAVPTLGTGGKLRPGEARGLAETEAGPQGSRAPSRSPSPSCVPHRHPLPVVRSRWPAPRQPPGSLGCGDRRTGVLCVVCFPAGRQVPTKPPDEASPQTRGPQFPQPDKGGKLTFNRGLTAPAFGKGGGDNLEARDTSGGTPARPNSNPRLAPGPPFVLYASAHSRPTPSVSNPLPSPPIPLPSPHRPRSAPSPAGPLIKCRTGGRGRLAVNPFPPGPGGLPLAEEGKRERCSAPLRSWLKAPGQAHLTDG